jgi:hypothetical protein
MEGLPLTVSSQAPVVSEVIAELTCSWDLDRAPREWLVGRELVEAVAAEAD